MNKLRYLIGMMLVAVAIMLPFDFVHGAETTEKTYTIGVTGYTDYTKSYEVLDIVNEERAAVGLEPLTMDIDLLGAAMKRAAETAFYFSHTRPDGTSCFTVCEKAYGENIAAGSSTATGVMDQWMNSEGHKANILTGSFTTIGIGCFETDGITYWVQLFGMSAADELDSKPTDGVVKVTFEIKKQWATFEPSEELPLELAVGEINGIELVIQNKGWEYAYFWPDMNSFDWSSSDSSVVTVNSMGDLIAKAPGKCVITGKYQGTDDIVVSWEIICKKGLNSENVQVISDYTYTGEEIIPQVVVKTDEKTLVEGQDYAITASNNIDAGIATVYINGINNYTGTIKKYFTINPLDVQKTGVEPKVEVSSFDIEVLNGVVQSMRETLIKNVTISINGRTLEYGKEYHFSSISGSKTTIASFEVTFKGNYVGCRSYYNTGKEEEVSTGKVEKNETIKLAKGKITKIKKIGKKKVSLKLKKVKKATFYEIRYATNKKFKKSKIKKVKKLKVTIGKLKKGKKYYFKVRAYTVDANGNRVNGKWSAIKKIKM